MPAPCAERAVRSVKRAATRQPAEAARRGSAQGVTARLRVALIIGSAAGLAACADNRVATVHSEGSVLQEAASYRARAKHFYAPPGPASDPWGPYIEEASSRFDVPGTWIRAVMMQESGGREFDRNGGFVTSIPGAMGLMQLMPPTYDDMRSQYGLGDDPYDPHDSIFAGTAYIRQMYDIYGSPGFLAAYNDGPGNVDAYLRRGRPLPRETRRYVASIGPQIAGTWPSNRSQADLMVAQHDPNAADPTLIARNSARANAVSSAWRNRGAQHEDAQDDTGSDNAPDGTDDSASQPVQVAEAAAPAVAAPAPAYTRNWSGATTDTSAQSVSAAWARRGVATAPATTPAAPQLAAMHPLATPGDDDTQDAVAAPQSVTAQPIPVTATLPAPAATPRPTTRLASFHFISPAMAEPLPTIRHTSNASPVAAGGNWAIQVGAYASAAQAQNAVGDAHRSGGAMLSGARALVAPVATGRTHLFRARLTGLSREEATAACHRLGGGSRPCVVVSPNGF